MPWSRWELAETTRLHCHMTKMAADRARKMERAACAAYLEAHAFCVQAVAEAKWASVLARSVEDALRHEAEAAAAASADTDVDLEQ